MNEDLTIDPQRNLSSVQKQQVWTETWLCRLTLEKCVSTMPTIWNKMVDGATWLQLVKGAQHRLSTDKRPAFHHKQHYLALTPFCACRLRSTMGDLVGIYQEFSFERKIFLGNEKIVLFFTLTHFDNIHLKFNTMKHCKNINFKWNNSDD